MDEQVKLGDKVRDKVTGIQGTLTGTADYLHALSQGLVECEAKDNKSEAVWLAFTRLEKI